MQSLIHFFTGRGLAYGYKILEYLCFRISTVAERLLQNSFLGKFLRHLPDGNLRPFSTNERDSRAYFVHSFAAVFSDII